MCYNLPIMKQNAVMNHEMFETRAKANEMILEYIEVFYNRQRMHSSNNYLSPIEFEDKLLRKKRANFLDNWHKSGTANNQIYNKSQEIGVQR